MKPLIIANWKMNPGTLVEAKDLFDKVTDGVRDVKNAEVVICPPFPYLSAIKPFSNLAIKLGSQDCFWEEKGAFTGEVSPSMIRNLGCQYVILGHSERRKIFGETGEIINKKVKAALGVGLKVILCIGETAEEKEDGKTYKILEKQLKEGLESLNLKSDNLNLVVAYEPIWAIGTGNACNIEESKKSSTFLRGILNEITIIYGGSVTPENSHGYLNEAGFDGLLVGGASLKAAEFVRIVKNA